MATRRLPAAETADIVGRAVVVWKTRINVQRRNATLSNRKTSRKVELVQKRYQKKSGPLTETTVINRIVQQRRGPEIAIRTWVYEV
jgi:hypothetical protein